MARVKAPLFSFEARKQLGKTLIYKMKAGRAFVTRYNFPGYKNPFTPSAGQVEKRDFYRDAFEAWQAFTNEQKDVWNDLAKSKNLSMSGWNLFYQTEFRDPTILLGDSIFGVRFYGLFNYGKE